MILYHGSDHIIEKPVYGQGKVHNDYGQGFYCTEHLELAREWACTEDMDGYVNCYELDLSGLKVLDLSEAQYGILHWITLLLQNRTFDISAPVAMRGKSYLIENYAIDTKKYDVIKGYRADDSYFSFAKAFLNNTITLEQLSRGMYLGKLGEQIVLKSQRAFDGIRFQEFQITDTTVYYPKRKKRDNQARKDYLKMLHEEKQIRLEEEIYLIDLMRRERS